jgi:tetratricopeptide (TPR) repeat protein
MPNVAALVWALFVPQAVPACRGPAELEADIARHSTAEAYSALAYSFAEQRNFKCAIAAFRFALKLDPTSFEAHFNLAGALLESGDVNAGTQELHTALRLRPADQNVRATLVTVLSGRANALLRAGRRGEAAKDLEEVISLKPDSAVDLNNLGILYQDQQRLGDAEKLFRRAVAAAPRNSQYQINLALTLTDEKRFTEASHVLRSVAAAEPANMAALTAQGMVMMRLRQLDDAIVIFRKVAAAEPASASAHLNLGIALADSERQAEALACFDQAIRLSPRLAAAHFDRGRALYDLKRYDEAKPAFETARRLNPADIQTVYRLGLVEARLNHMSEAAALLKQTVAADPKNASARSELGQALVQLGDEDAGLMQLRKAVELDPSDSQATYALLRVLSGRDSPEAARYAQRVREMKKEELSVTQARALSNFALDAAREKRWPEAISKLREAVATCGTCAIQGSLRRNLGLILAQSGDTPAAIAELQHARKLDPEDRDIEYALRLLARPKGTP